MGGWAIGAESKEMLKNAREGLSRILISEATGVSYASEVK